MSEIAIIIPCYNEEKRLPAEMITDFLKQHSNVFILLVNDGSKDKTATIIESITQELPNQIRTIHLEKNYGKAEAIRRGMIYLMPLSNAEWFGYWDADLATPLDEINHLLNHVDEYTRLLMCSRIKRLGATIKRHFWRHILGRLMATLISFTLRLPVYDTQCGAKLVHREIIDEVFSEPFSTTWLFDVEIISRAKKRYVDNSIHRRLLEIPVNHWEDIKGSKLKFKHMFFSLIDIVRIYVKLYICRL